MLSCAEGFCRFRRLCSTLLNFVIGPGVGCLGFGGFGSVCFRCPCFGSIALIFAFSHGVGCFGCCCYGGYLLSFVLSRGVGCFGFQRFGDNLLKFLIRCGVGWLGVPF